jgi:hypothetical protein
MFDALSGRRGPGGFLSASRDKQHLALEPLEERDVPALISGFVFADTNANGVQDVGEVGLANSTVQLFDGNNALVGTAVTDAAGMYQFTRHGGPAPGPAEQTYELSFGQAKTNHDRAGTLPMFDASLGQLTSVEIIAEGGLQSKVLVENLDDAPADMQAELKGSLKFTVNGQTLSATPTQTLQATLGQFDGTADLGGTSANDFGTTTLSGSFQTVTLTSPGDLAGFVGAGTVGVAQNARMQACVCGPGNLMAAISSVASGKVKVVYHYLPGNDLGPGTYKIVQASQPQGFLDGLDSTGGTPVAGSNKTDFLTVGVVNPGDQLTNNSFGELRPSVLSGTVYHDINRTGRFDLGDQFIPGVLVTLTGTDIFGDPVMRQTVANAQGFYAFGNLIAGTYTVRESQPAGFLQGTNNVGSKGGAASGDSITTRLEQATNAINYNFGEVTNLAPPPNSTADPIPWGGKRLHTSLSSRFRW